MTPTLSESKVTVEADTETGTKTAGAAKNNRKETKEARALKRFIMV
ncbi:MAG: hypothetical protein QM237_01430 [Bacteroidota bacterium]|nr:hypothetical protein [Bacteroidota bacterium]